MTTEYGEGFGLEYTDSLPLEEGQEGRNERVIVRQIGGKRVTIKIRDKIAPTDPLIVLTKAALYARVVPGARFPAPPVNRKIKEALIRTAE